MVWFAYCDDEPDTFISFDPIFTDTDQQHNTKNPNLFVFDFVLVYRRAPELDSDSDENLDDLCDLETRIVHQTHVFDKDWLIGGDRDQIQDNVFQILEMIQVPSYSDIVHTLTIDLLDLKKSDAVSDAPEIERIRVEIDVIVPRFPGENGDVDLELEI